MPVITPTIGRRVLLFMPLAPGICANSPKVPFDAGIAYVWNDSMINCGYTDHNGTARAATSVRLHDRAQNDSDQHDITGVGPYAVWMPYQFEQALKHASP